jgi:hypothetical protein
MTSRRQQQSLLLALLGGLLLFVLQGTSAAGLEGALPADSSVAITEAGDGPESLSDPALAPPPAPAAALLPDGAAAPIRAAALAFRPAARLAPHQSRAPPARQ